MKSQVATRSVETKKEIEAFRKSARSYTDRVAASKASARKELVRLGIYTKSGQLAKNYR